MGNIPAIPQRRQEDGFPAVHVPRGPLTFARYSEFAAECEALGIRTPVYVQMRKRGEVMCARLVDATPAMGGASVDFFQVVGPLGQQWVSHWNVRMCSGDGKCLCEHESGAGGDGRAAAGDARPGSNVPLGNTGITAVPGAR